MNVLIFQKMTLSGWIRSLVTLLFITSLVSNTEAQQKKPGKLQDDGNEVLMQVDHSAEFQGGINKFYDFLAKNLRYPAKARENKVQGKVFLTFIVEKNGSLSDIKVVRGIGSGCDEEAVRVIKSSPKWKPGTQNGHIVRQQYTVPIMFSLSKTGHNK